MPGKEKTMGTIRVTGKGRIQIQPDTTRITLTLKGTESEYGEALRKSSQDAEQLRVLLARFGFERSDLKTLDFGVDAEYESYEEEGACKRRFAGYSYSHVLKVEFPFDNNRLGRILYAMANSPLQPEFWLSYTVGDPEAAKNELLGAAVADAREKAAVLAQAAGVRLKDIRSIDYSWGEIDFEVRPMQKMRMEDGCAHPSTAANASYDLNIAPDDIEAADTVTVIWETE